MGPEREKPAMDPSPSGNDREQNIITIREAVTADAADG
jgi:hypothetical protein